MEEGEEILGKTGFSPSILGSPLNLLDDDCGIPQEEGTKSNPGEESEDFCYTQRKELSGGQGEGQTHDDHVLLPSESQKGSKISSTTQNKEDEEEVDLLLDDSGREAPNKRRKLEKGESSTQEEKVEEEERDVSSCLRKKPELFFTKII